MIKVSNVGEDVVDKIGVVIKVGGLAVVLEVAPTFPFVARRVDKLGMGPVDPFISFSQIIGHIIFL